jgi:hypothetical protein
MIDSVFDPEVKTPPDNDDPLELVQEASWKYQYDEEFRVKVDTVVAILSGAASAEIPEGMSQQDRITSTLAISMALYLEEING